MTSSPPLALYKGHPPNPCIAWDAEAEVHSMQKRMGIDEEDITGCWAQDGRRTSKEQNEGTNIFKRRSPTDKGKCILLYNHFTILAGIEL